MGAGASTVYGLPAGRNLKDKAIRLLEPDADATKLIRLALKTKYPSLFADDGSNREQLTRFREELRAHRGESIDEFVEDWRREKHIVPIGKAVRAPSSALVYIC